MTEELPASDGGQGLLLSAIMGMSRLSEGMEDSLPGARSQRNQARSHHMALQLTLSSRRMGRAHSTPSYSTRMPSVKDVVASSRTWSDSQLGLRVDSAAGFEAGSVGSGSSLVMGMADDRLGSGSNVGLAVTLGGIHISPAPTSPAPSRTCHGHASLGPLVEGGVVKDVEGAVRVVSETRQIPRVVLEGTLFLFLEEKTDCRNFHLFF
ncbi:hypothetical protein PO909_030179 [Leuciscus waleckii]